MSAPAPVYSPWQPPFSGPDGSSPLTTIRMRWWWRGKISLKITWQAKSRSAARQLNDFRESFQLVSANIVHDVLVEMASTLTRLTTPDGYLVLAGILRGEQEENIVNVYRDLGFTPLDRLYQDEWVASCSSREKPKRPQQLSKSYSPCFRAIIGQAACRY